MLSFVQFCNKIYQMLYVDVLIIIFLQVPFFFFLLFARQKKEEKCTRKKKKEKHAYKTANLYALTGIRLNGCCGQARTYTFPKKRTRGEWRVCCAATLASLKDSAKPKLKLQPSVARMLETIAWFLFLSLPFFLFLYFANKEKERTV